MGAMRALLGACLTVAVLVAVGSSAATTVTPVSKASRPSSLRDRIAQLETRSVRELVQQRDAYSRHYLNKDGSVTALISSSAINRWVRGSWRPVKNVMRRVGRNWTYSGARYSAVVPNRQGAAITLTTRYGMLKLRRSSTAPLRLAANPDEFEMDFLLRKSQRARMPNLALSLSSPSLRFGVERDRVVVRSGSRAIATVTAPVMVDARGAISRNVKLRAVRKGRTVELRVVPQRAWLSSPKRRYPVIVDPAINFGITEDATYVSSWPPSWDHRDTHAAVGFEYDDQCVCYPDTFSANAYMKFDVSSVPSGQAISSAAMLVTVLGGAPNVSMFEGTQPWGEEPPSNAGWNPPGNLVGSVNLTTGRMAINITSSVNRWRSGTPNHGLVFVADHSFNNWSYLATKEQAEIECFPWNGGYLCEPRGDPNSVPILEVNYAPEISLDVTLNPLTATSHESSTSVEPNDWGASVRTTVAGPGGDYRSFKWHFDLPLNQRLEVLPDGKLAVLADIGSEFAPVEEDFPDAEALDPNQANQLTDSDVPGADPGQPDAPYVEDGEESGDNGPPTSNEGQAALDALASAQDQVDDPVIAVATAPQGRNSLGHGVQAWFTVIGNNAMLNVANAATGTYPVTVDAELYEFLEDVGDPEAEGLATLEVSCPVRPQIITYNPNGWFRLLNAFKANPTACADYYIVIPGTAANKTVFRTRISGRRIVDTVCEGTAQNSVGARFFPVAEFHWGDWEQWLINRYGATEAQKPSRWLQAGAEFRKGMHNVAGYGTPCVQGGQDILPYWAVNELPDNSRIASNSILKSLVRRQQVIQLVQGLHDGPDQKRTAWRNLPGIAFVTVHAHAETNFKGTQPYPNDTTYAGYRDRLRDLLLRKQWWNALAPRVKFWSQEVFTNCWKVCLPQIQHVPTRGKLVSDYAYHPMHFLDAGIDAGQANALAPARRFLRDTGSPTRPGRYSPLLTAYWGPPGDPNVRSQYGETNGLAFDTMKGHISLQMYTVKRKVGNNPRPRIGFAWYNAAGDELAVWIAERLRATFGQGGVATNACFEVAGGTNWCQRSVPTTSSPPARATRWHRCWPHNFRSWTNATRNCT